MLMVLLHELRGKHNMTYADLSKAHRRLEKVPYDSESDDPDVNDAYWAAEEVFRSVLRTAVLDRDFLRSLTKASLLRVIKWSSRFRPMAPHMLLATLSNIVED